MDGYLVDEPGRWQGVVTNFDWAGYDAIGKSPPAKRFADTYEKRRRAMVLATRERRMERYRELRRRADCGGVTVADLHLYDPDNEPSVADVPGIECRIGPERRPVYVEAYPEEPGQWEIVEVRDEHGLPVLCSDEELREIAQQLSRRDREAADDARVADAELRFAEVMWRRPWHE